MGQLSVKSGQRQGSSNMTSTDTKAGIVMIPSNFWLLWRDFVPKYDHIKFGDIGPQMNEMQRREVGTLCPPPPIKIYTRIVQAEKG